MLEDVDWPFIFLTYCFVAIVYASVRALRASPTLGTSIQHDERTGDLLKPSRGPLEGPFWALGGFLGDPLWEIFCSRITLQGTLLGNTAPRIRACLSRFLVLIMKTINFFLKDVNVCFRNEYNETRQTGRSFLFALRVELPSGAQLRSECKLGFFV